MMIDFDIKVQSVLTTYHKRIATENKLIQTLPLEEGMKMRDEFLLPVGREVGQFLNALIKGSKAKTILEIGTSYGYSTLWLAEAARANKGKVITLENNPEKVVYAKQKIEEAGLIQFVDFRVGDALESIENATETFDFVLLDIWKELYVECFDLFYSKLNKGAWVLGDNMLLPPHSTKETNAYRKSITNKKTFTSILMPIGSGIEVSHYKNYEYEI